MSVELFCTCSGSGYCDVHHARKRNLRDAADVARLNGVGCTYHVVADFEHAPTTFFVYVTSGPAHKLLDVSFDSFRAAIEYVVDEIDQQLEEQSS